MSLLRKVTFVVIGIFAVVAIGWLAQHRASSSLAFKPLSDGSRLIVEGVTYGTNHELNPIPLSQVRMLEMLPRAIQNWPLLRRRSGSVNIVSDQVVVWLTREDAHGKYIPVTLERAEIRDDDGCVFGSAGWTGSGDSSFPYVAIHFPVAPRRAGHLKLTAHIQNETKPINFLVPNRKQKPFSKWQPDPLPIVYRTNAFSITLESLQAKRTQLGSFSITPQFQIRSNGIPAPEWNHGACEYSDPTGNHGSFLCPSEPVMRLRAYFFRNEESSFSSNEVWRVGEVQIPAAGEFTALNRAGNPSGRGPMTIVGITGPGTYQFSNDNCVSHSESHSAGNSMSSSRMYVNGSLTETIQYTSPDTCLLMTAPSGVEGKIIIRSPEHPGKMIVSERSTSTQWRLFNLHRTNTDAKLHLEVMIEKPVVAEFTFKTPQAVK